jgi:hypothetical protein
MFVTARFIGRDKLLLVHVLTTTRFLLETDEQSSSLPKERPKGFGAGRWLPE